MRWIMVAALLALLVQPVQAGVEAGLVARSSGDFATALTEFRGAARSGDAVAQYQLGLMYDAGEGVPEDNAEAVNWYRLAADQGHADAQQLLGFMYARGEGLAQDPIAGYAWSSLAADQGNEVAGNNRDYLEGRLGAEELVRAKALARELVSRIGRGVGSVGATSPAVEKSAGLKVSIVGETRADDGTMVVESAQSSTADVAGAAAGATSAAQASTGSETGSAGGQSPGASTLASGVVNAAPGTALETPTAGSEAAVPVTGAAAAAAANSSMAAANPAAGTGGVVEPLNPVTLVRELQLVLAERGYRPGPVDGVLGPRTRAAIRAAEQALGRAVTGQASMDLLSALRQP